MTHACKYSKHVETMKMQTFYSDVKCTRLSINFGTTYLYCSYILSLIKIYMFPCTLMNFHVRFKIRW